MGYRGRGHKRNTDKEVDASSASHGKFIRTHRGDDDVTGSDHGDYIFTGRGDDTVEGGGGNDVMFGGRGQDTAVFSGSVLDYKVLSFGCGRWNLVQGADGCDLLHSFEILQFDDFTLDLRSNNDPLVILRDDGLETSQGEALSFQVDFYDIDGSSVELVSASVTGNGTLTTQDSGVSQVGQIGVGGGTSVSFEPGNAYDSLGAGESITETVTLVISDGQGGSTTVTYDITIEGQNDAPLALAVSATASEDAATVVVSEFSDIDTNDSHSFTIDTTDTRGVVTNNGDGTFGYDPTTAFATLGASETATDTFLYTVADGNGGVATETVTITIQGQNDAPVAMAVSDTADEDGPAITISADVSDVDISDIHTFSVDTTDTLGVVTNNGDGTFAYAANGVFDYLSDGETATDAFTYTVDDGNGGIDTETVTVTITGQNDAPIAGAVTGTVGEDSQVADSDSVGAYTIPNAGRFYVYDFDTGTATTIPRDGGQNNNFDQIAAQYLSDGNGVIVQPNPNNSGWGFAGQVYVDGAAEAIAPTDWVINGGNGAVDVSGPQWIGFADNNQSIDSIELNIDGLDLGNGVTVDAHISVGPLNYEYLRTDDLRVDGVQFSSALNGPSPSVTVAAEFADPDSDAFVFTIDDSSTLGDVINNGDGTFTYSANGMFEYLDSGETATDTFAYTVDDGNGGLDTAIATIIVTGSDDILFA
ncbi:Ig-like domain-containing protein [uncultured Pelagimonas sp.]|uniref:Ig-like domain-containing protein n=1 Tax=uncultured Pelagimonas sp. TaxID=1618102 RepID=UPI00260CC743|nr:Ig-like domain-containing protein [uncultured Pelagimonas sp.]